MDRVNEGATQYDALEIVVTKRLSSGLMGVVNYTLSKQFEQGVMAAGATTINTSPSTNAGYLNNGFDAKPWRSISGADRTHRLVITALYDLPSGRDRRVGGDLTGLAAGLASGWQINVIGEIQSGTPTATPNAILLQPTAKLPDGQQSLDQWFDNSTATNRRPDGGYAWAVIPPNDFRTLNVRFSDIRDPWEPQWAFSVFKNTRVGDRVMTQIRIEAFNAFNTPIYGAPDVGVNSSRFGKVTPNQINFPRHVQLGLRVLF